MSLASKRMGAARAEIDIRGDGERHAAAREAMARCPHSDWPS